jgi:hypothetical protein
MTSCHNKEDWKLQKLSSSSLFKEKFMTATTCLKMIRIKFKKPVKQSRRRKRRREMTRVKEEKGKRK